MTASTAGPPKKSKRAPKLDNFTKVTTEPVEWVWWQRIPRGELVWIDGDPGEGKSYLTIELAARLTKGDPLPGDHRERRRQMNVLIINEEDSHTKTIKPRLEKCGANMERVYWLPMPEEKPFNLDDKTHQELLRDVIKQYKIGLVVIDPADTFTSRNLTKKSEARAFTNPLMFIAHETDTTILLTRHLTKPGEATKNYRPIHRGAGDMSLIGAARSALLVERDPDDPETTRLLFHTKSNLGPLAPTLTFRIENDGSGIGHFAWGSIRPDPTPNAVIGRADDKPKTKREEAKQFLQKLLPKHGGQMRHADIEKQREAKHISRSTLHRAREDLGIQIEGGTGGAESVWRLAK